MRYHILRRILRTAIGLGSTKSYDTIMRGLPRWKQIAFFAPQHSSLQNNRRVSTDETSRQAIRIDCEEEQRSARKDRERS
jgi:hypothetical protein